MAEKEKSIMKKKTVKLVSAVVVLGVACGAYVGVNSYVSSQEAKEAEEEDKSVDLISLKADEVTAVSFKADDADVEFDRKDDSWTEKSDADFPVNQDTVVLPLLQIRRFRMLRI
jgi:phosphopantothenoylcysteine synthetase/decarboxylase